MSIKFGKIFLSFQIVDENVPLLTAAAPHPNSTEHLLKQCSVRLERLPLKITTGDDFQKYPDKGEIQGFDHTSRNNDENVLDDNLQYGKPQTLPAKRPIKSNHSLGKSVEGDECRNITNFSDSFNIHTQSDLTRVQFKHSLEKPFKCNECDYSTANRNHWKTHIQCRHSLEKSFKCSECYYSSADRCHLKRHVQFKHSLEKPFKCSECDYSSAHRSHLKMHVQYKHTLEKPFKCSECDYSSADRSHLKRHVQFKHSLEKPFKCSECDYSLLLEVI